MKIYAWIWGGEVISMLTFSYIYFLIETLVHKLLRKITTFIKLPVLLNSFVPNAPFLYTLKTSGNRNVSDQVNIFCGIYRYWLQQEAIKL